MRTLAALLSLVCLSFASEPTFVVKPDAFATLVNPNCSHCVDEAKRRKDELKDSDPVLMWTRGKYDGGSIPFRFFLNPYRVISDTYGVFVYDPDAGFARGFTASVDFRFHGWRNGVMVMKHKDGTLYSCLTGLAFDGPRKGERLTPWPTVVTDWGWTMRHYAGGVAYHMFDKYKPTELPTTANVDSVNSRGEIDKRRAADEIVLGVYPGGRAFPRAFPLTFGDVKAAIRSDVFECGRKVVVLYQADGNMASAYEPRAERREAVKDLSMEGKVLETKEVTLKADGDGAAPFVDEATGSRFDAVGRCVEGSLKGWTLVPYDAVKVRWFAWAAEHPDTKISQVTKSADPPPAAKPDAKEAIKEVAGSAEFLRAIPKKIATLQAIDAKARTVTLLIDGETEAKAWPLTPDAEVKVAGWWGRLEQFAKGARVWAWFHTDRKKAPTSIFMLADEASEGSIHGKKEAAETKLQTQRDWLRERWIADGLPGTVTFAHVAGEADVMLDHEAMRWGRSLQVGDKVALVADPPIAAVVKDVRPWRERTQVRLVINGLDIAELKSGQRIAVKMPTPAKEVEASDYPPDIGRKRTKEERIDWFLASIYCTCMVGNDICTGDFYTLASCNPNGCGNPNGTRKRIAEMIDKGLDDKQIFDELRAERGPLLVKPHLKP
ncbi:MAG TPA: DUF3179 domain-containing (seleno)protein [Gemmataceae bacterium]|nr:DUF3179 domain-containing (seleno)protein [Gemmataceae bacterium]